MFDEEIWKLLRMMKTGADLESIFYGIAAVEVDWNRQMQLKAAKFDSFCHLIWLCFNSSTGPFGVNNKCITPNRPAAHTTNTIFVLEPKTLQRSQNFILIYTQTHTKRFKKKKHKLLASYEIIIKSCAALILFTFPSFDSKK